MPELEVVIITPEQPLNMDYEWFFLTPASRAHLLLHIECKDQASEWLTIE